MKDDIEALIKAYNEEGYLLLSPGVEIIPEFEKLLNAPTELVYEKDENTLRSIYGFQDNPYFIDWLQNNHLIKSLVQAILGPQVYLHQTKINLKNRNESSIWPFHRDFPFWKIFDHFPNNRFLNVVVYIDEVFEGSGALEVIPKSHLEFLAREEKDQDTEYSLEGSASSDLLFSFSEDELQYFKLKYGLVSTLAPKGSLLLFDPNLIHGSGISSLDFSRKIMILTFNACENLPTKQSERPNYLCNNNKRPLAW